MKYDSIEYEGDLNMIVKDNKINNRYTKEEKNKLTAR